MPIQKAQGFQIPATASARDLPFPCGLVLRIETDQPDDRSAFPPGWSGDRLQLGNGRFHLELQVAHTSRLQIVRVKLRPGIIRYGTTPNRSILFAVQATSRPCAFFHGAVLGEREIGVVFPGEDLDFRVSRPYEMYLVAASPNLVAKCVSEKWCETLEQRRALHRLRLESSRDRQIVCRSLARLLRSAVSDPDQLKGTTAAGAFDQQVLEAMLTDVSPVPVTTPLAERCEIALRAEAYLRENAHRQITIRQLCEVLGIRQRTLEMGFRERFGMTPKNLLKTLRLNGLRRELQNAEHGTTISESAVRWGFNHFGRLAMAYREMFEELPSETMQRARPRR